MSLRVHCLIVSVSVLGASLSAQEPRPAFEVTSVKKVDQAPAFGAGQNTQEGGLFRRAGTTLQSLIQTAYELRDFQVIGGPDWMRSDLFEITARAGAGDVPMSDMRLMLQSLLAERFRLIARREQREMRFFAMMPARADGRLGPYLHQVKDRVDCTSARRSQLEAGRPKPVTGFAMVSFCGDLSNLASGASRSVEMPIFDRTGLTGMWMADVYFAPEPVGSSVRLAGDADPNLVRIEIALQEQLGLKLERTRGPVDVLVIESVQQPSEN